MNIKEAKILFSDVVCPSCNEKVQIDDTGSDLGDLSTPFLGFSLKAGAPNGCFDFNAKINHLVNSFRSNEITFSQLRQSVKQYVK